MSSRVSYNERKDLTNPSPPHSFELRKGILFRVRLLSPFLQVVESRLWMVCIYVRIDYSFAVKEPQLEQDPTVTARLVRLSVTLLSPPPLFLKLCVCASLIGWGWRRCRENEFDQGGIRRTVEGVLVVHDHGHPNVLLLQVANAFFKLYVAPFTPFSILT